MGAENRAYLAFDLGASSGRLMAGMYQKEKLTLTELHRFSNAPVRMGERLYWDLPYLLSEMKTGLKKAAEAGLEAACIGIDTWGVDYGYLAEDGSLLAMPFCYRDPKNQWAMESWPVDFKEIYQLAGLQKVSLNTAYQLYYDVTKRPQLLKAAKKLLFMPDLLGYFLTGEIACEYTVASTSMLVDAKTRDWSDEILARLPFPKALLPEIRMPGQILGTLLPEVQQETGLGAVPVALVGSHDTASALAGIPFTGEKQAFLSSGTWSLMGLELEEPLINEAAYEENFANEGSVCRKIKFLKNICGLWVLQQLRKEWHTDFPTMIQEAEKALDAGFIIDPDAEEFTAPISMEKAVKQHCKAHGQGEPQTRGEIAAAVYEGLTEKYRQCILAMEHATGQAVQAIHMVGGGIQDELLCRLTAQKTGRPVITGPIEAAAYGNILLQQMALGELSSLEEGRQQIGRAVSLRRYEG
ncbi:MAG: rhamnulokinase [Lachnospiraceae bacterium]|jgi:rhamnulokinase|nr:rhamnulokinase [Lachnospiraceae bacterium]